MYASICFTQFLTKILGSKVLTVSIMGERKDTGKQLT